MMATTVIELLLLILTICISVNYAKPPRRMIDAKETGNIPYQVSIQESLGIHICGGTIIDVNYILTAAHCIVHDNGTLKTSDRSKVIVGVNNLLETKRENVYDISRVAVHDDYDYLIQRSDIAILKLSRNITFSKKQHALALPVNDTVEGTEVMATGWGAIHLDPITLEQTYSSYLRGVPQVVISQERCQEMMNNSDSYPEEICTWSGGASSPCKGDSGGPLSDSIHVVGITSYIKDDTCPAYPTVYTRVYKYISWIENMMAIL